MKSVIANGRVWTAGQLQELSLLVNDDGRIAGMFSSSAGSDIAAGEVIDARGQLVLPGGVDMHVHVQDGAETFSDGTRAAAAGGITTVVDIGPFRACTNAANCESRVRLGEQECVADFTLAGGIVVSHDDLSELAQVAALGAPYFKVFMPSDPPVDTSLLWACVQAAARTGLRLALHAEEVNCLAPSVDWDDPLGFPRSRPIVAETSATAQVLEMAAAVGAPVHICHVSAGRTADLVAEYRARGVDVTAETTPHFLLLDEDEFIRQGARVKTTPPLRMRADSQKLWEALREGVIDALACDHYLGELPARGAALPSLKDKEAGIAGLELSLPLIYDAGVRDGRLSLARFVEVTAFRPAAICGLAPRKGAITVGADADLVFIDPDANWTVADRGDFSRIRTTPFVGLPLRGAIRRTMVRGRTVWNGRGIAAEPGWGRFIPARHRDSQERPLRTLSLRGTHSVTKQSQH